MSPEIIYIPLLDEGTTVCRPVAAERLSGGLFRIVAEMPDDEVWAFRTGQMVSTEERLLESGEKTLVAVRVASRDRDL
jgi:hypothetical protein